MITRIGSHRGRWYPVTVEEASPKELRQGLPQYSAGCWLSEGHLACGYGDTIEEAVDDVFTESYAAQ